MAFEFKLLTDEIREKMFAFIKPVYKGTYDFEVEYINWIYGVYDSESRFFITYVNTNRDNDKYVFIKDNGNISYIAADRYKKTVSELPKEFIKYSDMLKDGIMLYNNQSAKERFKRSFSAEQEKIFKEITENMKDRCRPSINIKSYEEAEALFKEQNFNYHYIIKRYNKETVAKFNQYMPEQRMAVIRGEEYVNIIKKISAYHAPLSEDDYKQISWDFQAAGTLVSYGMDDIYQEITFDAIKKGYSCRVVSAGYTGFIKSFIKNCLKTYPEKIQELRPVLDFINENMRSRDFQYIEFYRKELEKRIYNRTQGFDFVLITDELREKMFDFLKPEYQSINDLNVTHINWTTGVYDKGSGIFLTRIYYVSEGISRCGVNFYSYLIITDSGNIFRVENNDEWEKGTYDFRIPKQYLELTDKVKEGIDFYDHDNEYRESLGSELRKELERVSEEMFDRCHLKFPINCEKDAEELFKLRNCNAHIIRKIYNKKTVSDFNNYATDDKIILWKSKK